MAKRSGNGPKKCEVTLCCRNRDKTRILAKGFIFYFKDTSYFDILIMVFISAGMFNLLF